jgi:phthiodiolone/phenolphthiodiolone dimycocerosates ketoreductase
MPELKLGASGVPFPPIEASVEASRQYEARGLDFIAYWDQLNLTIPRSIWTPDVCPAAEHWDIDTWMEPWPLMAAAALATEKIEFVTVNDSLRRPPALMAQLALTMSHISKGRFFYCLGAGEMKQFKPYGLARPKPFTHLEEALKIVALLCEQNEPVSYDGPIWQLENAIVGLAPYEAKPPTLMVAGGPGKALRFGATLGDGWMTYLPACASPEQYAQEVAELKRIAEQAGKDPDELIVMGAMAVFTGPTEEAVEEALRNPVARWDAAVLQPGPGTYERMTGKPNPFGADWSYARDLIPMSFPRESALAIIDQVTPDDVRACRFTGIPEQVAEQMQPYIDAGLTHLLPLNCSDLVLLGNYTPAETAGAMSRLWDAVRERNPRREASVGAH